MLNLDKISWRKQAYAPIQALKDFRTYVLHSRITTYIPNHAIKTVLTQPDTNGKRGRWIAKILQFDLDIKTTKLVKGQGLSKLLAESNCKVLRINFAAEMSPRKNP